MLSLRLVCVAALLLLLGLVGQSAEALIFRDFTKGTSFSMGHSLTAPGEADAVYHTGCGNGHLKFALYWNGDLQDAFSMAPPVGLSVVAQNKDGFCHQGAGSSLTFTSTTPNHCNFTASWTTAVSGVLGITYNTGDSPNAAAQEVSIPFDTSCPNSG